MHSTRIVIIFALFVFWSMFGYGCGSSKPISSADIATPKETLKSMPSWFEKDRVDDEFFYGKGTATSEDLQLSTDKAKESATREIASKVEVRFNSLSKRFQEEVGTGNDTELLDQFSQITRSVISTTLTGLVVDQSDVLPDGETYRAYVLMKYPVGASDVALMDQVKAKERLWTRFRASEMSKELDAEVEKYEQWKKEQGK